MQNLPNPYIPSIQSAIYKQSAEDFIVNENLSIDFSDKGEHLWLFIKKTNLNTNYVTKLLAKWANIPVKDVGFSGLKDRHAVTTQWFSLRLPKKQFPEMDFAQFIQDKLEPDEVISILKTHWHTKKLNRGTHQSNQFIITLHDVIGKKDIIEQQLLLIQQHGIPNYFGEQRFGHDANNINKALELFTQNTIDHKRINRKFDQDKISLLLSAARSELFNAILAKRIENKNWNTALLGDVMNLTGSNSIFVPQTIDAEIIGRLQKGDINITGALWGDGELKSFGKIAKLENEVVMSNPTYIQLSQGLVRFGLKQQRRSLRLILQDLSWQWLNNNSLQLNFSLPSGSFATSVLFCLIKTPSNL